MFRILPPGVAMLDLDDASVARMQELVDKLLPVCRTASDDVLLTRVREVLPAIPSPLRTALGRLRDSERESALLITGLGVDDVAIGPTPRHWRETSAPDSTHSILREELLLALVAESIGYVHGYETLQEGHVFHNLLPIIGEEEQQNGHSSSAELVWHSEDAFTDARCDFLALFALRNPDHVGTMFAAGSSLDALSERDRIVLSEPRFHVRADDEHLKNLVADHDSALKSIHDAPSQSEPIAVLHGGPNLPYLVIDKAFMTPRDDDIEATRAFHNAVKCLDDAIEPVALKPGDLLLMDNHRAVHGRAPFTARYDGTDRWLLKVSVARDLMKSRAFRASATSRVVR